jgi:hypothetical protein
MGVSKRRYGLRSEVGGAEGGAPPAVPDVTPLPPPDLSRYGPSSARYYLAGGVPVTPGRVVPTDPYPGPPYVDGLKASDAGEVRLRKVAVALASAAYMGEIASEAPPGEPGRADAVASAYRGLAYALARVRDLEAFRASTLRAVGRGEAPPAAGPPNAVVGLALMTADAFRAEANFQKTGRDIRVRFRDFEPVLIPGTTSVKEAAKKARAAR